MNILLLGEYSNLHNTLAQGLRALGHNVTLASDGDGWKNYSRDINISRKDYSIINTIKYIYDIVKALPKMKGYDVVQIINPLFFELKPSLSKYIFDFLKKHNKKIFLGAFGVDHYWVKTCIENKTFRYSDFYRDGKFIDTDINRQVINEWIKSDKATFNKYVAERCDGIIACLYEYFVSYKPYFPDKTHYISLPINTDKLKADIITQTPDVVKFFIGIQKHRSQVKGTDVIYEVLKEVNARYPDKSEVIKAESVPYNEYVTLMRGAHILIDQLYSYTPAMNALTAMAQGLIVASGAEPEYYELEDEHQIHPILNITPDRDKIFTTFEDIILNPQRIPELSVQSVEFINRHDDYKKVAARYIEVWNR